MERARDSDSPLGNADLWTAVGSPPDGNSDTVREPVWLFVVLAIIVVIGLWLAN